MAQHVKITTLATVSPSVPTHLEGQVLVDNMRAFWQEQLAPVLPDRPDLIVLPEMCDRYRGFTPTQAAEYYHMRGEQLLDFFSEVARAHKCYIAYSGVREAGDGSFRNATRMINRMGDVVGTYHKNHVVIPETTEWGVLCGTAAPIIECDFGRVACAICFDLNFDELRLKYVAAKPDLILFPSLYHGGLMQAYWAYSCRAHFVGACSGLPSSILSPLGEVLATNGTFFNFATATVNLDCRIAHYDENWEKLQALKAAYGPQVTIHDPGLIGSFLVTSEATGISAAQMLQEFEIELLDDYMARSIAHQLEPKHQGIDA